MKVLSLLVPVLFLFASAKASATVIIGQCTPRASVSADLPRQIDIYLEETLESGAPYYLKGKGFVRLIFADESLLSIRTGIVSLHGYDVTGSGFSLHKLKQDWRNPSPHTLVLKGKKAAYNCLSY